MDMHQIGKEALTKFEATPFGKLRANGFIQGFLKALRVAMVVFLLNMLQLASTNEGAGAASAHEDHAGHYAAAARRDVVSSEHIYYVPDTNLIGADGRPASLRDELDTGTPVMLNFIFTTCTNICPVTSATFSNVEHQLGVDRGKLRMVSISIDPENDTPDVLRKYAQRFKAGSEWKMLTGKPDDILAVQRAFEDYRGSKMNHAPITFIRASAGQSWARVEGFASAAALIGEYRRMVK